jgi:class 3 adenylate cyclase/predicted ATPase
LECPRCQFENPDDNRFCGGCGAPLDKTCPSCGHANPSNSRFCGDCGTKLAGAEPTGQASSAAPQSYMPQHLADRIRTDRGTVEGERKQVTVLFADIKGSLELIQGSDPERVQVLLDEAIRTMMEAVHRYEGTVNKVLGDGIMALFGAPLAHEDHSVRACYAALAMQDAIRRSTEKVRRIHGVEMLVRVGLNSGEVVVRAIGNDLSMDYDAIGETTHLAARMEQLAVPGTIRMTGDALQFAEGFVQVKALGPIPVKGLEEPVEAFELTGATTMRTRFQAALARGLSRFVGRQTEIEALGRALDRAGGGDGQIVTVIGEAGVGKSRLFYEFTHSHRTEGWLVLESGSVSYGKATAYLPVIDLLKAYFRIEDRDDQRQIREKVTGKLVTLDEGLKPLITPLLTLLDVAVDDEAWEVLDPSQHRRRTLDAVKTLLLRESAVQPLAVVFEDLHWIDSETQVFLDSLVESLPASRILLLANYRPEYSHGWGSKTFYTQRRIDPLPAESADELLVAMLGADADLATLRETLIERTGGNPFFIEESVRTLVEAGTLSGSPGAYRLAAEAATIEMPATVQGVLAARIDRLPAVNKRLLQTAAVVGKDVPYDLLLAIADMSEEELRCGLSELQTAEFVYETRLFPDPEYTFKHALTHEVAYGSLLRERRRELHQAIAEAIEVASASRPAEQFERLAHHYTEAGLTEQAVDYWQRAGQRAVERSANGEAVTNLKRGLELLEDLPETSDRSRQELSLQLGLGVGTIAVEGAKSPQMERVYTRACELCQDVGDPAEHFAALWGLWRFRHANSEFQSARVLAEKLSGLARRQSEPTFEIQANHAQWTTRFYLGEFAACREHAERVFALYDAQKHHAQTFRFGGHDPCVCGHVHAALSLWVLGYPDQSVAHIGDAIDLARRVQHPQSLMLALIQGAQLHQLRREILLAKKRGEAAMEAAREIGFSAPFVDAFIDGWAAAGGGQVEKAITSIREGLAARRTAGRAIEGLSFLGYYIDLLARTSHADEGMTVLENAFAFSRDTGTTDWDAEFHRQKGVLLLSLADGNGAEAEACFKQAIKIARGQSAKSFELRAATDLARLWQGDGKEAEARDLLAPVYDWFTEGFDTADLKGAKALLDDLA